VKIIPAIDLLDGNCVRLLKGNFNKSTAYSTDPAAVGRQFSQLDVQDLHLVDLDGARSGHQRNHDVVAKITAETSLSVQLGGGIRRRADVVRWLNAGVQRCVIGSVAITEPDIVRAWIEEFGAERIVLALDVRLDQNGVPLLSVNGWTAESTISLWDCLDIYANAGIVHILCTDIARDGAMSGPNLELYAEVLSRFPSLQLQASGGVRNIADLHELKTLGLPAAISGRALLDGEITAAEVAAFRQSA